MIDKTEKILDGMQKPTWIIPGGNDANKIICTSCEGSGCGRCSESGSVNITRWGLHDGIVVDKLESENARLREELKKRDEALGEARKYLSKKANLEVDSMLKGVKP